MRGRRSKLSRSYRERSKVYQCTAPHLTCESLATLAPCYSSTVSMRRRSDAFDVEQLVQIPTGATSLLSSIALLGRARSANIKPLPNWPSLPRGIDGDSTSEASAYRLFAAAAPAAYWHRGLQMCQDTATRPFQASEWPGLCT